MKPAIAIGGLALVTSCGFSLADLEPFPCATNGTCPTGYTCITEACHQTSKLQSACDSELEDTRANHPCAKGQVCLSNGGCVYPDEACACGFHYDATPRLDVGPAVAFGKCAERTDLVRHDGAEYCVGAWTRYDTKANCGGCGNACGADETCEGGTCKPCSATLCGERCVDVASDGGNCGTCGNACPKGASCKDGKCECAAPNTLCGATCRNLTNWSREDTITSAANTDVPCGSCTTFCAWGEYCQAGRCVTCASLGAGFQACKPHWSVGWLCVDVRSNSSYCGRCDWTCNTSGGYICRNGTCSR